MKKVQLLALLLLIITQSTVLANNNLSTAASPSPRSHFSAPHGSYSNIIVPFRAFSPSKTQLFTDVTLLFTNSFSNDFDVFLYNTANDDYYEINIHPNAYQQQLTVPEGTYDVHFFPNDQSKNHHYYSVACGYTGGGFGLKSFYGVNITSELYCNTIYIE